MTHCSTKIRLDHPSNLPVEIEFSADDITSDGGAILLSQAEARLGVCRRISQLIPDARDPARVVHSRAEQLRQRVVQIALGYADQNDANWLRGDPLIKLACGLTPGQGDLSAQATLSRFERTPALAQVHTMCADLIFSWVHGLDPACREVVLDLDSSAFKGYGQQQELFYNGYYRCHMLHPLLLFEGESGQLITAIARPGSAHDAQDAVMWIHLAIVLLKTLHHPDCAVLVRADAGFASPEMYRMLEELDRVYGDVSYLIGVIRNSRLEAELEEAMAQAREQRAALGRPARVFADIDYQAKSWQRSRRILAKAEVTMLGDNPRFVVTNLEDFSARMLYEVGYCGRGRCEQYIKEFKGALRADRISCSSFAANAFRLILHALAYRLLFEVRRTIAEEIVPELSGVQLASASEENTTDACSSGASTSGAMVEHGEAVARHARWLGRAGFATLRLRLLKVAFVVRQSARRIYLQGARSFPMAQLFGQIARTMS